jgi:hypothetical protein
VTDRQVCRSYLACRALACRPACQGLPRESWGRPGHFVIRLENNGKVSYEVAYATPAGDADFIIEQWEKRQAA